MPATRRSFLTAALASVPTALFFSRGQAQEPLTAAQSQRLQQFLPRTSVKLARREPVRVAVCGDDISHFYQVDENLRYAVTLAWPSRMLDRIGGSYHYHAGVVDTDKRKSDPDEVKAWQDWMAAAKKDGKKQPAPGLTGAQTQGGELVPVNELLHLGVPQKFQPMAPEEVEAATAAAFMLSDYSRDGAVAVSLFEPLFSEVFLQPGTDLVFLVCGARDATGGDPLSSYRDALLRAVKFCQENGADVILGGPPPALDEPDERRALGRARPYAAIMREVAEKTGVFFADAGLAMIYAPSDLLNRSEEAAFAAALAPLRKQFLQAGQQVAGGFHPNVEAHRQTGDRLADWLLNGTPQAEVTMRGSISPAADDTAEVTLRVVNLTEKPVSFVMSPLSLAGWLIKGRKPPEDKDSKAGAAMDPFFKLPPGKMRSFIYLAAVDPAGGQSAGDEDFTRGSAILTLDDVQTVVDYRLNYEPAALLLTEFREDKVSGELILKAAVANNTKAELDGTAVATWRGTPLAPVPLKIPPGQQVPLPLRLSLPDAGPDAVRFSEQLSVVLTFGAANVRSSHRIEGVRHIGLRDAVAMETAPGAAAGEAPVLTVQADMSGMYLAIRVPAGLSGDTPPGKPWGVLEVQVDGRGPGANGTMGYCGKMITEFPREDDVPPKLKTVRPSVFGEGTALQLTPKYFRPSATTQSNGDRKLEFNFSRHTMRSHEWSLDGSGQTTLGLNVRLTLHGSQGSTSWQLARSEFPGSDARSLTLLELTAQPAAKWSVRAV